MLNYLQSCLWFLIGGPLCSFLDPIYVPQDRVFLSSIRATAQLYSRLGYFNQTHPLLIFQSWRYVDDGISAIGAVVDRVLLHLPEFARLVALMSIPSLVFILLLINHPKRPIEIPVRRFITNRVIFLVRAWLSLRSLSSYGLAEVPPLYDITSKGAFLVVILAFWLSCTVPFATLDTCFVFANF